MSTLPLLIISMTMLFIVILIVQSITRLKFCAVCVVVSTTWLVLLVFQLFGYDIDARLIAVLMGESVVGLYFLLEKRAPESWHMFRWPYIMTGTALVYVIVGMRQEIWRALGVLIILWIVFGAIAIFRQYPTLKKIAERIIACCRDW